MDFPYADKSVSRRRPALVLALFNVETQVSLAWVLMITSARHSQWPGDVAVTDLVQSGVSHPCYVRTEKIATVDLRFTAMIGRLAAADRSAVRRRLQRLLGPVLAD